MVHILTLILYIPACIYVSRFAKNKTFGEKPITQENALTISILITPLIALLIFKCLSNYIEPIKPTPKIFVPVYEAPKEIKPDSEIPHQAGVQ